MAGSKKNTRKKTVSAAELERRKAASQRAWVKRNPVEHHKNQEREHYIGQFRALNEPMTEARLNYGFGPLERAVFEIEETGEGTTDEKGNYIFCPHPGEGIWYGLPRAITKACDVYEAMNPETGEKVAGLRRLARRLELHMPLFKPDMDAAREGFMAMREEARKLTPNQLIELAAQADPDDDEEPATPA
jgi:hypothetical protein